MALPEFESFANVSYHTVLTTADPGARYNWVVNGEERFFTLLPNGTRSPLRVQLQFQTLQPGADVVSIQVVDATTPEVSPTFVIITPMPQRQRRRLPAVGVVIPPPLPS